MWLETKFQPFRLRNDKDMGCRIDLHTTVVDRIVPWKLFKSNTILQVAPLEPPPGASAWDAEPSPSSASPPSGDQVAAPRRRRHARGGVLGQATLQPQQTLSRRSLHSTLHVCLVSCQHFPQHRQVVRHRLERVCRPQSGVWGQGPLGPTPRGCSIRGRVVAGPSGTC